MKKVIAFVLSTICVFSLVGCGIKTSNNTDTKKYYIPVIVLNGQVYVARGDIVSELPDGYSYAGELTEEEKQYAYMFGSRSRSSCDSMRRKRPLFWRMPLRASFPKN